MPTYEYECNSCKHHFELFQSITAESTAACPECGAASRRKISGGTGIIFKGSGFYLTDYHKQKTPAPAKTPGGEAKTAEGTSGEAKATSTTPAEPVTHSASPRLGQVRSSTRVSTQKIDPTTAPAPKKSAPKSAASKGSAKKTTSKKSSTPAKTARPPKKTSAKKAAKKTAGPKKKR